MYYQTFLIGNYGILAQSSTYWGIIGETRTITQGIAVIIVLS
jgi:hypothetical protein